MPLLIAGKMTHALYHLLIPPKTNLKEGLFELMVPENSVHHGGEATVEQKSSCWGR